MNTQFKDWRYSDERMDVRTQGLNILLHKFGENYVLMDLHVILVKVSTSVSMIGYLKET